MIWSKVSNKYPAISVPILDPRDLEILKRNLLLNLTTAFAIVSALWLTLQLLCLIFKDLFMPNPCEATIVLYLKRKISQKNKSEKRAILPV